MCSSQFQNVVGLHDCTRGVLKTNLAHLGILFLVQQLKPKGPNGFPQRPLSCCHSQVIRGGTDVAALRLKSGALSTCHPEPVPGHFTQPAGSLGSLGSLGALGASLGCPEAESHINVQQSSFARQLQSGLLGPACMGFSSAHRSWSPEGARGAMGMGGLFLNPLIQPYYSKGLLLTLSYPGPHSPRRENPSAVFS